MIATTVVSILLLSTQFLVQFSSRDVTSYPCPSQDAALVLDDIHKRGLLAPDWLESGNCSLCLSSSSTVLVFVFAVSTVF